MSSLFGCSVVSFCVWVVVKCVVFVVSLMMIGSLGVVLCSVVNIVFCLCVLSSMFLLVVVFVMKFVMFVVV